MCPDADVGTMYKIYHCKVSLKSVQLSLGEVVTMTILTNFRVYIISDSNTGLNEYVFYKLPLYT